MTQKCTRARRHYEMGCVVIYIESIVCVGEDM